MTTNNTTTTNSKIFTKPMPNGSTVKIEIIPIVDLTDDGDLREVIVKPSFHGWDSWERWDGSVADAAAALAAEEFEEPCVALVYSPDGSKFAVTKPRDEWGNWETCELLYMAPRFVLFNARKCEREHRSFRAVTLNTGAGALTRYWYDQSGTFEKGSFF